MYPSNSLIASFVCRLRSLAFAENHPFTPLESGRNHAAAEV
jgi:hypothetical protein